jgi:hypothetical protein
VLSAARSHRVHVRRRGRERPDHALIANTRIKVGAKVGSGYRFQEFRFDQEDWGDQIRIENNYPGFVVDGRKVRLGGGGGCTAYGVSSGCRFSKVGRYRRPRAGSPPANPWGSTAASKTAASPAAAAGAPPASPSAAPATST